jgi:26S proteasome regulatory subunit N3
MFAKKAVSEIKELHRATLYYLNAQVYHLLARVAELNKKYAEVRTELFEGYTNAQIRGDTITLATVTNGLLRFYIISNQYELASQLITKGTFPEQASNNQLARFLYYQGKIASVQLEYSDAHTKLLLASRKAPQKTAKGFRLIIQKHLIIVELLMGEIPERTIFSQAENKISLTPYYQIVQSVRAGNLPKFGEVVSRYKGTFLQDGTLSLIQRLRHNVLKFGLRKIYLSYSRISLADICEKLNLENVQETEYVVAKAIRDGVIEATINHEEQYVQIKPQIDIYASNEPMAAFDKRVKFCLELKNEAVKALEYPKKGNKEAIIPVREVNNKEIKIMMEI